MNTLTSAVDLAKVREEWVAYVERLVDELAAWLTSHPDHPKISRGESEVVGLNLERYVLPSLEATFGDQYITVEPRASTNPGRGSLAITSWPNLRRVYLVRDVQSNSPKVWTESRIPLHQTWDEVNFHVLISDLLADE